MAAARREEGDGRNTGSPRQPDPREGQAGPYGVAERSVVPGKPGNAGGGKGPWVERAQEGGREMGTGASLTAPERVRRLQAALHAKAKEAPGYRFAQGVQR